MDCTLEKDPDAFPGAFETLFSKGDCMKPTAVYARPRAEGDAKPLNVVLWLHGYYVLNKVTLFTKDKSKVREQVRDSGKDVVLIAPHLGYKDCTQWNEDGTCGNWIGTFGVDDLGKGSGCGAYLDRVLKALSKKWNPSKSDPPTLDIKSLVIACHSAGGSAMRSVVGALGRHRSKLKECWGFDCLYSDSDAKFWAQWRVTTDGRPLTVYYGPSTIGASVKLDLISQGRATFTGDLVDPPGPPIGGITVLAGHYEWAEAGLFSTMGKIYDYAVDELDFPPAPKKKSDPKPNVEQIVKRLRKKYPFDKDAHYEIARRYFLRELRDAAFF
jgi:hypothetical protein